jgi:hypothetical protein
MINDVTPQIWLIGNTLSDLLIASAMIYHVNGRISLRVDCSKLTTFLQLHKRRRDTGGFFSDHYLLRIIRVTVESNILTSTYIPAAYAPTRLLTTLRYKQQLLVLSHF